MGSAGCRRAGTRVGNKNSSATQRIESGADTYSDESMKDFFIVTFPKGRESGL